MNGNLAFEESWEELLDGRMVDMSPRPAFNHNVVAFNIARLFANHLRGRRCIAIADGTDLYLTEKDRFVPDMMVVCDRDKIKTDGVHGTPDLVVEVLSPSTAQNDRGYKKSAYESCGVREYWIVSPNERSVEQYLLYQDHLVLNAIYTVYPDFMLEKMSEAERACVVTQFKCSLYDDLIISLDDIFDNMI